MLKNIIKILAIFLVVLVIVIALRPSEFKVSRSVMISAPAEVVFAQVNDFHKWEAWSPWVKLDPNAKNIFEGPSSGVGSIFRWIGNQNVGEGAMTIIESRPNEAIKISLDFIKPFPGTSTVNFDFKSQGTQTSVTWSMSGKNSFMAKAVGLFMDCDKMIGDQYEKGLSSLKAVVEGSKK
jgi:hypothetical protein